VKTNNEADFKMIEKTWFVTGASRGIGLALVNELLRRGYNVIGACRNPDGERDFWEIKRDYKERFDSVRLDVTDLESIRSAALHLRDRTIDVLINNAGILKGADECLENLDLDIVRQSFEVNTIGPMQVTKEFLSNLQKSGSPKVINMTSLMGSISDNKSGGYYAYRMSKTALNMFGSCLAKELPRSVVLSMHPGWVKTAMGGPKAPTEALESAVGIIDMVERATLKDSGHYFDYKGQKLPW
jgi:NAD(P)-dependent dehydrogenase (short-subunit alcohol dehydrogenase family)